MPIRILTSIALCLGLFQPQSHGQVPNHRVGKLIVKLQTEDEVTISIMEGIARVGISEIDSLNMGYKCEAIERIYQGPNPSARNLFLFSFPEDSEILQLARFYSINGVSRAEPDLVLKVDSEPNDPFYPQQWGLSKIKAPFAWDIEKGSAEMVISLNDTGLDWEHPDMQANIWINDQEDINGNGTFQNFSASSGGDLDGVDNDSNGYTDDVIGWNFYNGNNNPQHITGAHGTNVAGTAAAVTNNSIGMAGVSWNSKIMACRVGDGSSINLSNAIAGIYYAVDNGAHVINMSWSGSGTIPSTLNTAILQAANSNVAMVSSAGNENNSNPRYPASHALVLGVAAVNEDDTKHFTSSYGTWVDVSAPGFNVFLNYIPGDPNPHQYSSGAGTSTASPFVSGLAALIFSLNPGLSDDDVRNIILTTTDNIDAVNPGYVGLLGTGRTNAYQALLLTHAYSNNSMSPLATAQNNGRRLVKTSDGRYHLVFESGIIAGEKKSSLPFPDVEKDSLFTSELAETLHFMTSTGVR